MEFVKVQRDDLIKTLKEYIDLLKKCPKSMEFHTCIEFCGIDPRFLVISKKYYDDKLIEAARKKKEQEEQGTI